MSRILLLVDHQRNRALLQGWLSERYEVVVTDSGQGLQQPFDLAILDGMALDRCWKEVEARKEAEAPVFLPFLLVTSRKEVGLATRHLWRAVDELVLSPIVQVELCARLKVLLRARDLSLQLHERSADLARQMAEQRQLLLLMAGRELKAVIRELRAQLRAAGLEPVANDPLAEE